jgi:4'-phosphopantetheinyl transferase
MPVNGEVHLWRVPMDEVPEEQEADHPGLSAEERYIVAGFRFRRDRARFVRRRAALRTILAGYLGAAPRDIDYQRGPWGKPELGARFAGSGLVFNATDSGDLALIACSRGGRIGVDVEALRPAADLLEVARRFFSTAEYDVLSALDPDVRAESFYRAWTRKEAVVKGLGGGLSVPLAAFDVTLAPGEPASILRWMIPGQPRATWSLHHFEPGTGFVGALAVDGEGNRLSDWELVAR